MANENKAIEQAKRMIVAAGFELEDPGFYTARGGNGTDCAIDPRTLGSARLLVKQLAALGVKASVDTCDEWVSISI